MYRGKEAFLILYILFYLHVDIHHHGYLRLTTALCKRCPYRFTDIHPSDLRVTSALSPHYQQYPPLFTADSEQHL